MLKRLKQSSLNTENGLFFSVSDITIRLFIFSILKGQVL